MDNINFNNLPGRNIIEDGLSDLARGQTTIQSLLVSIGSPRLESIGIPVQNPIPSSGIRLFKKLSDANPDSAHSQYNAWIRRLVSFERAAECVR